MSDEELIARLRKADEYEPLGHDGWEAADRIEALEKERQAAYAEGFADAEAEISATAIGRQNAALHDQLARAKETVGILQSRIESLTAEVARLTRVIQMQPTRPQDTPDPALRPTMTDMMVDPNTLDAFMEANPLPPDPAAIRILALIQKGGDAHDKNPIDARSATSPGVTAGAIQKGAADDR